MIKINTMFVRTLNMRIQLNDSYNQRVNGYIHDRMLQLKHLKASRLKVEYSWVCIAECDRHTMCMRVSFWALKQFSIQWFSHRRDLCIDCTNEGMNKWTEWRQRGNTYTQIKAPESKSDSKRFVQSAVFS